MTASKSDARAVAPLSILLLSTLMACVEADDDIGTYGGPFGKQTARVSAMDAGALSSLRETGRDGSADGAAPAFTGGITCNDVIAPVPASIEPLLQRSCGLARSCHAGDFPQAGLDLSTLDGAFRTAVGRPATQAPSMALIAPGKPEQSYVLQKIRNMQQVGTAMPPPPSAPLCEAKLRAIEAWIRDGAER